MLGFSVRGHSDSIIAPSAVYITPLQVVKTNLDPFEMSTGSSRCVRYRYRHDTDKFIIDRLYVPLNESDSANLLSRELMAPSRPSVTFGVHSDIFIRKGKH